MGRQSVFALPFIVAALALAVLPIPLAAAHALPVEVSPPSGAVVPAPPREVVMRFSEALDNSYSAIEVRDANGTTVSRPSSIDQGGITMRAGLASNLTYGTYTVAWRALSAADGHTTRGLSSFLFPDPSMPLNPSELPPVESQAEAVVSPLDGGLRALGFGAVFVALGTAVLVRGVVGPLASALPVRAERRLGLLVLASGFMGACATIVLAASQASAAAQVSLGAALFNPALAFTGHYGALAEIRAPLLGLAGILGWAASREGAAMSRGKLLWTLCGGAAVGALATLSLSSHSAALQSWTAVGVGSDMVHLAAAAVWVGGLIGLGWVLLRESAGALRDAEMAARFSTLATASVGVVVFTGVVAALLELHALRDLWASSWGLILLAKVALVAGLLAFGWKNKFRLVPALAASDPIRARQARERFGRSVRAEAVLGVAVILAAGILTTASPPAPLLEPHPPAILQMSHVTDGVNLTLLVSPSPARVGYTTFDLFLYVNGTSDLAANNATLTFLPPDRSLGQNQISMDHPHPGHFAAEGSFFTMPGSWSVRVLAQRANAYDAVAEFEVSVESPR